MAFVHDEYGHFEGLVTPGRPAHRARRRVRVRSADFDTDPPLVERDDGSWWVSGSLSADALSDRLGISLPEDRDYATAAGFALVGAQAPTKRSRPRSRRGRRAGVTQSVSAIASAETRPDTRRLRSSRSTSGEMVSRSDEGR